ncbi:hypothetical protein C8Q76DRAFT_737359 [Earliella scabrosa]|nr:hypothetical protein C8Q76DRAFT_737359 [Earliella scabrosa]
MPEHRCHLWRLDLRLHQLRSRVGAVARCTQNQHPAAAPLFVATAQSVLDAEARRVSIEAMVSHHSPTLCHVAVRTSPSRR